MARAITNLVDCRSVLAGPQQVLQVFHTEVADADGARLTRLQDGLHRGPRLVARARRAGRVHQVQVDCRLSVD